LDWVKLEQIMAEIYASKTGRPSYPLLTLLRASLLGIWYRLSDAELAQSLFRDLLFRKFCHLELGGDVPDATTIGRFRARLMELGLWEVLLSTNGIKATGFQPVRFSVMYYNLPSHF
jgi:IS5 family transposase